MADASWDAFKGQGKFQDRQVDVRALMVLYPNRMHIVTVEGTGINKMSDLKGKRVSTGAPNSATQIMAYRVLEAYGIDPEKDIIRERLDPGKSADAIKDKKLDAFFWVGGLPTPAVTDLGATPGIKLKLVDHADALEAMVKKYGPLYVKDTIPAKTYPGQETTDADRHRLERAGCRREADRPARLRHREDAVRAQGGHGSRARRGARTST